jgi:hypothetical protein
MVRQQHIANARSLAVGREGRRTADLTPLRPCGASDDTRQIMPDRLTSNIYSDVSPFTTIEDEPRLKNL